ncbi:SPP1 family phage portal protein [Dysgonomonas sp. PH5-45]|uniref:phage portal protein n=1 Tax=unclassified Dysgonomonas TaxID=2630389 RepID=UPI002474F77D|nr:MULTISPECIES: phage portal protein [unclassified Dysgonomonas]MDH6354741.1 SPP1 family phage portal protein [Dysgonomonas sp. PH5-45]MDH6387640.1 SPP1 family phage portal protein [Dysgonomonas sp. PH5-37]
MGRTKEELLGNPQKILIKKPFTRGVTPYVSPLCGFTDVATIATLPRRREYVVSQDTFLDELDPYSHAIHSRFVLDDKKVLITYKEDIVNEDGDVVEVEREREDTIPVTRMAFPFQEVIATKQKVHLTGNDLQLTLANETQTTEDKKYFTTLKQFYISKNMDIALSENVENQLTTGDTALLQFFNKRGELDWKVYSWKDGYCLLPHYDEYDELILFGIYYSDIDGDSSSEFLDVWDDTLKYRYKKDGYEFKLIANPKPHGFKEIPIAYKRGDVAWNKVQKPIEDFELHASLWAESVRYYGDPLLFLKGSVDILPGRDERGKVLAGEDGDADGKLLQANESKNVTNLMDFMLKEIFRGSHTISFSPETVKTSGDLPGITVKLLFSSAVEKAISEAKKWDGFIDRMLRLFIYGIGIESKSSAQLGRLKVFGKIIPYIPQNDTEIISNINNSKSQGTISVETATDIHPYAAADENKRVAVETEKENSDNQNSKTETDDNTKVL